MSMTPDSSPPYRPVSDAQPAHKVTRSPSPLRGGNDAVPHPRTDADSGFLGGSHDQVVLSLSESDGHDLAVRVRGRRPTSARVHAPRIAPTETLDQGDFSAYGKSMTNSEHLLLIQTREGGTVAVRFPSRDAASKWEDEHEYELGEVIGLVTVVTKAEALRRG